MTIDNIIRIKRSVVKHLLPMLACISLLLGGCSTKAVIPFPGSASSSPTVSVTFDKNVSQTRKRVVEVSHQWIGTPYMYAHAEKGIGSDCSGMVMGVFQEAAAKKLPRNSAKQAEFCKKIRESEVLPGDLVFFATGSDPDRISHVGIMIDKEKFVHASSSKGTIVSSLHTPYYTRTLRSFGRIPDFE